MLQLTLLWLPGHGFPYRTVQERLPAGSEAREIPQLEFLHPAAECWGKDWPRRAQHSGAQQGS